ncbi:MAG: transposase [Deltaproteobacteria bacterium HGW-Deltaproteobacteria-3]|nr:MAG: transposase [Deltaproteobacteria bacterium HGW-Deltaproteobacteria-3]
MDTAGDEAGIGLDRRKINLTPGAFVLCGGVVYRIFEVVDFETIIGVDAESGKSRPLRLQDLKPCSDPGWDRHAAVLSDLEDITDLDWKVAEQRYEAIKPLLASDSGGRMSTVERAREVGVDPATLYRWVKRYRSIALLSTLIPMKRGWRSGAMRISKHAEAIIGEVLQDTFLTAQRPSPQKAVLEVLRRCRESGVDSPHPNTVRARIAALSEKQRLRGRGFKEKAKNKFLPAAGRFPNADYPLAVVQIDHTPADIILVDDIHRKPIGRPWITLAIDVFSRMVAGYYLSFDPPSETSVAMCVAHAILPKDEWLAVRGVDVRWDVWGVMDTIHVDNGADFRSNNFRQSCLAHGINLEFRPVKQPRYGGHIERMLGTLMKEIHSLPGTTFSSVREREGYDSEKHAAMTKTEFETWLVTLICKVYHQRLHAGIGMSPVKKWEIGMFGNAEVVGRGLPPRPADRQALLLDFLPSFRRTIQTYGVSIEGLNYYADVLRSWINSSEPKKPGSKREFIFRRDPRDISVVWFYDPDSRQYFRVPFANQALPTMSVWEYQQARSAAKREGMKSVDENRILRAITELRAQVEESRERTKKARRQSQRRREHEKGVSPARPEGMRPVQGPPAAALDNLLEDGVEAFDDIV